MSPSCRPSICTRLETRAKMNGTSTTSATVALTHKKSKRAFSILLTSLEPDVLKNLGRLLVQTGRLRVVATLRGKVASGDPGRGAVARRANLLEAPLGGAQPLRRFVQPALVE